MKDYLDFIDSRSLREDLRLWRTLPPAMQCIVVAQSGRRSLADKLAALRELLAATPPGDFADGEYQLACNDLDFAAALDRHIRRKEERLAAFLAPAPDAVYVPHDPRNGYDIAAFATFAECLESVRDIGADNDGQILVVRCRAGKPDDTLTGFLGPGKVLADVESEKDGCIDSAYDEWRWNFAKAYVRVPPLFRPGDIVRWGDERFAVVVHPELPPVPERWRSGFDCICQFFSTLAFSPDKTHPCGGVFSIHDVFPLGLPAVERIAPEDLPEEYGVLLAVADVVGEGNCICQLLESYSQGRLDSLVEDVRRNRDGAGGGRAVSLKEYKGRIWRLQFPLAENWCLCRYFQLYDPGNDGYAHSVAVLEACLNHLKHLGIRRMVDKRRTLVMELVDGGDFDDADKIARLIREEFKREQIADESWTVEVASDFAARIDGLIDAISDDSIDVDAYVRDTLAADAGVPESPKLPRKLQTASSFVYRLASRYDKGETMALSPEDKSRLRDSLNILAEYGRTIPWAQRESDFASFLLATIPLARGTERGEKRSDGVAEGMKELTRAESAEERMTKNELKIVSGGHTGVGGSA